MNHYQRVYFLSRQARLTVFGKKGADFSSSASDDTEIVRAPFKGKLGVIIACFFWMITRGRSKHFDVVLTEPSKLCICGLFGKIMLGAKWVVDVWDIPFRCGSKAKRPWRRCVSKVDRTIARFLFRFADLFILSVLPDLEFAEFGVPKEKMLLLRNAIWLDTQTGGSRKRNNSLDGPFTILCMRSRFTHDMGLDLLAQAFDTLNQAHPDVELVVVGKIPDEIRPQIALLAGRTNVRFHEFMKHDELISLIISSSACVIPFRNTTDLAQTYPIKVLEYLSQGAIVVAAGLPGIASMIKHEYNGLLFEPDNPADLAEKLRCIYRDRELSARIALQAAMLGDEYDCRKKAETIFGALQKLVS
ncbi:MAG: glycosyltransferase family 4 protein [Planctomycetota bacterium]